MRLAAFGYVPTRSIRGTVSSRIVGVKNLIKRAQAADIFRVSAFRTTESVLDFGCGTGYLTMEIARKVARVLGFDLNPELDRISLPRALQSRVSFVRRDGRDLRFLKGELFDVVFLSEVLTMLEAPSEFLAQASRALKPGGRFIVVNGCGHPAIEEMYRTRDPWLDTLRREHGGRVPESYREYERTLLSCFGTGVRDRFLRLEDLHALLEDSGFEIREAGHSPPWEVSSYISRLMFVRHLTGRSVFAYSTPEFLWHLGAMKRLRKDAAANDGGLGVVLSAVRKDS